MIRSATVTDIPRLVELGRHQVAELFVGIFADNPRQVLALVTQLVSGPNTAVFVVEQDGQVMGMIGMMLYRHHVSGALTAGEVSWFLERDARGCGVALMRRAERWAAEHGAAFVQMMAPNQRVGQLYERRGYRHVEVIYQRAVTAEMSGITVVDDVLLDPEVYRNAKRQLPFGDIESNGVTFHGIAGIAGAADPLSQWIAARYPALTPTLTFVRQSPEGQDEPNFIHTDRDMGEWTGIYYLTENPPKGDGTTFWRDKQSGALASQANGDALVEEWQAWRDLDRWEPWTTVEAKPNRLVLFPAPYFHSRAIPENFGQAETARLIQVVFGTGGL